MNFGVTHYDNLESLILNELSEVDILFKLKNDKYYRRGRIVAYVPLQLDECLVGIRVEDFDSSVLEVEYYAFKEINVKRYVCEEDDE